MGSTRKLETKLGESIQKTRFTPPSLIKATPTAIANNLDDVSTMSVSNADDIMMMLHNHPHTGESEITFLRR